MRSNESSARVGLSGPMKAGLVLIGSGVLVAALMVSGLPVEQLMWVLLIGAFAVGAALWLFGMFLSWREKRRAEPMIRGLVENVGAAPRSVSDPARRAELAALRKKFEEGLEKFRAAGKNIYSVPWYLFVGEPGCGKTEAVRHCNVPFPPGMQDQLQGAGGTINMDWWFTNRAIIIDTAGKLMFNEVEAAASPEWHELLRMLKAGRPNCPINGMLLAISAESLITNTADEIERKAGQIAKQFDLVQRTLGVRFPVFVVITKSDLINGFREFFESVEDPQLQHQIMGWSNPAPLDSPFSPSEVDQHLELVHQRLQRHRMWLLHDPVPEDPAGRRVDEVDRLYDFPEALMRLVPRLRRYLEMVFVAGEWSPKPLFLRGIYFTSSLREGEALDAVLAEAIGVDVKALPAGGIWERERAFFLRDLFMEKVFRERGLVTQASNARGQQRKRRATVLAATLVSVVVLLVLVVLSGQWYSAGLDRHNQFWNGMASIVDSESEQNIKIGGVPEIVHPEPGAFDFYYERARVPVGDVPEARFAALLDETRQHIEASKPSEAVPFVLKPLQLPFGDDLDRKRLAAFCAIVDRRYLRPLVDAAERKFEALTRNAEAPWTINHTRALEQLLLMKRHGTGHPPAAADGEAPPTPQIAPLLRLALGDVAYENVEHGPGGDDGDPALIQPVIDWLYFKPGHGIDDEQTTWAAACARLEHGNDLLLSAATHKGLSRFRTSWGSLGASPDSKIGNLRALGDAVEAFKLEEDTLLGLCRDPSVVATEADAQAFARQWGGAWMNVEAAAETVRAAIAAAYADTAAASVTDLYDRAVRSEMQTVRAHFEPLIAAARAGESPGTSDPLTFEADRLESELETIEQQGGRQFQELKDVLTRLEPGFLALGGDGTSRPFDVRIQMFEMANGLLLDEQGGLRSGADDIRLADADAALGDVRNEIDRVANSLDRLRDQRGSVDRDNQARDTSQCLLKIAQRYRNYTVLSRILAAGDIAGQVDAAAVDIGQLRFRPILLSSGMSEADAFDRKFSPAAAERILRAAAGIHRQIGAADTDQTILSASDLSTRLASLQGDCSQYLGSYVEYWGTTVPKMALPRQFETWEDFHDGLRTLGDTAFLNEDMENLNIQIQDALQVCRRVESLLDDTVRERLEHAMAARGREADALSSNPFLRKCRETVRAWLELGRSPAAAGTRLRTDLGRGAAAFTDTYLSCYLEPDPDAARPDPGADRNVEYWNLLLRRGVDSLAGRQRQEAIQAREQLIEQSGKFPLCLGREDAAELTLEEVDAAWQMIQTIGPAPAARADGSGGTPPSALDLGPGRAEMEASLQQFMGAEVISPAEGEWFSRLADLAEAFAAHNVPGRGVPDVLTCQIRYLDRATQVRLFNELPAGLAGAAANAVDHYEGFSVTPGQNWVATRFEVADKLISAYDVATKQVSFAFRVREGDPVMLQEVWTRDWNVLRALLSKGAVRLDENSWQLRLSLREQGSSNAYFYWVKVTFNRTVPALEQWPQFGVWPTPGARPGS